MLLLKKVFSFFSFWLAVLPFLNAQTINTGAGSLSYDPHKINTVTTAVPFLRIIPDARAGGMGDVGIAVPTYGNGTDVNDYRNPDVNGLYTNPAKIAFIDKDYGFALTFSPWLKALVNDIYLANITGYYKVKKQQTLAISLRYFSLGSIQFTDINGSNLQQFRPNEFAVDIHYARILGKYFSIAASLRYIYSNLAGGTSVDGALVKPGMAGSGDISWFFHKKFNENSNHKLEHEFSCGMDISNIGSKMSYTSSYIKDFIPTNMGIGFGYTLELDKHSSFGAYADFNKLMVPTPNTKYDSVNRTYYYREESSIKGMFTSFGDAPALEELKSITVGIGAEYFYNRQFGVRFGYFFEDATKGGRQFLTAGLTVKYSVVGLNFSYLIPTTIQRNPLDNTLRFTLLFDFLKGGKKSSENSGVSLVPDTPSPKKAKKEEKDKPAQPDTPIQIPVQPSTPVDGSPK